LISAKEFSVFDDDRRDDAKENRVAANKLCRTGFCDDVLPLPKTFPFVLARATCAMRLPIAVSRITMTMTENTS
jgi:hypothetical protein